MEKTLDEKFVNFRGYNFKGMVNPETGEIIFDKLSPKYNRVLSADLRMNLSDKETYNNKEILQAAKEALNKSESLSEKNKKAKKILALDKYTNAYDAFDIEPDRLSKELEANKKAQDEDLTPGQKSLVWEDSFANSAPPTTKEEKEMLNDIKDYLASYLKGSYDSIIPVGTHMQGTFSYDFDKNGETIATIGITNPDGDSMVSVLIIKPKRKKFRVKSSKELDNLINNLKNESYKINEAESKEVEFEVPGFWGFYESLYTSEGDLEYTFFDNSSAIDEHLMELFDDFRGREMEWSIDKDFVDTVSKAYVETFDSAMKDAIPSWKGSTYVETESPKEYNYTSDRVFAKTVIDEAVAQEIGQFLEEHKAEFEAMVKNRFTSYDGFISFYSNDANSEDWQKELVDMDHNELSTVFMAILETEKGEDIFGELNDVTYEYLSGNSKSYEWYLYDNNYNELINFINANAVMKPALDDLSELEKYLPTGEKENGLPVYELDLHDQPGQQHLDFSKAESLNRKAKEVLAMNEKIEAANDSSSKNDYVIVGLHDFDFAKENPKDFHKKASYSKNVKIGTLGELLQYLREYAEKNLKGGDEDKKRALRRHFDHIYKDDYNKDITEYIFSMLDI